MKHIAFGIFAHVDAGKTTLSERILFDSGSLRKIGRVDNGDTVMDTDEVERQRGITVFSDQYTFDRGDIRYTLIDTPGHLDFAAEAERPLPALDAMILVTDGTSPVRPHAATLFQRARKFDLPCIVFVNKSDLTGFSLANTLSQLREKLDTRMVPIENGEVDAESLAECDDDFLERYLSGLTTQEEAWTTLATLYWQGKAFPVLSGAALSGIGTDALLQAMDRLAQKMPVREETPRAFVHKVRHDKKGVKMTCVRLFGGTLRPRDSLVTEESEDKIYDIRVLRGAAYTTVDAATAGECVALTGLTSPMPGDMLLLTKEGIRLERQSVRLETTPTLISRVTAEGVETGELLRKLRYLEEEEPLLRVEYDTALHAIHLRVTGEIQLEILTQLMLKRFGIAVRFETPKVLYMETVENPVMGCGHYEPLRHYAEVHVRIEPAPRGSGIAFASECHVDDLPVQFQNLIRTHVFEKTHRGILTGAPLTDVKIVLTAGRHHLKHTEGGDFREATYRAIRQGLEKAENVLLEPFYRFEITVPGEYAGRVMTDIPLLGGVVSENDVTPTQTRIVGRGPVASFMEYPKTILSMTRGMGDCRFAFDGYEPCKNAAAVISEIGYNKDADTENPSSSVFCSHGAGFLVPWNEADGYMHCQ